MAGIATRLAGALAGSVFFAGVCLTANAQGLGVDVGGVSVSVDPTSSGLDAGVSVGGPSGVNADASVGAASGVNADVNASVGGPSGVNADVNADMGGSSGATADVGVSIGGSDGVNAGVNADVGGADGTTASIDASVGGSDGVTGDVDVGIGNGVGANVDVGVGDGVDVGLGVDIGGGGTNPGGTTPPGTVDPGANGQPGGFLGGIFGRPANPDRTATTTTRSTDFAMQGMSNSELKRLTKRCVDVLQNATEYDRDLVTLCRAVRAR